MEGEGRCAPLVLSEKPPSPFRGKGVGGWGSTLGGVFTAVYLIISLTLQKTAPVYTNSN